MSDPNARPSMTGTVTPPADMHAAARASLSAVGYARLMEQTRGAAPTPRQLCELVEAERAAT
jgi:hypothetical protein